MISRFLRLSTYIAVFHVDQLEPYLWIIVSSLDLSEIWGTLNRTASLVYFFGLGIPHLLQVTTLPCLPVSAYLIPSSCLSWRWDVIMLLSWVYVP